MPRSGYQILGFLVWQGAKLYLRRRYGWLVPSRRVLAIGVVGAGIAAALAGDARRSGAARTR